MADGVPELYVTNFNKRFTGVSSTLRAVLQQHLGRYRSVLVGVGLPGLPEPITKRDALRLSRQRPAGRPFAIWHVRRNTEMQVAILARDVLRLPIRTVFTSAAKHRHSAWPRFLISRMDRIIATSDAAARCVGRHDAVIPHGVDTQRFCPPADRAAEWAKTGYPGAYGIVTVGRIRPTKGSDVFVKAMIRALPDLPGATAVLVGLAKPEDQGFLARMKAEIAAAGMEGRIFFSGSISDEALLTILKGARLLCATPRYEPFGVTPLEGMACGLPIVATATGHFAECVGDPGSPEEAGRIVPVEDVAAVADAVAWALADEAHWAGLSARARARVERVFSIEREAAGIAAIYEALWAEG